MIPNPNPNPNLNPKQEMEAYRLYTVVPRLVHMIEELTNWYVRMNKERFAGERGDDERADALSTLFEVRLLLTRTLTLTLTGP